jgi:ankyrin repeat protein
LDLLVKHGAAVDAANKEGYTALRLAAMIGCAPAVGFLLEHGAKAGLQSVLKSAEKYPEVLAALRARGPG